MSDLPNDRDTPTEADETLFDSLDALVSACEEAFAGPEMTSFPDDADVAAPPMGITFGMIRRARAALTLMEGDRG